MYIGAINVDEGSLWEKAIRDWFFNGAFEEETIISILCNRLLIKLIINHTSSSTACHLLSDETE